MLSKQMQVATWLLLGPGLLMSAPLSSQDQDVQAHRGGRLVSRQEGEAIAQAALQHWPQLRDKPDCSHLVHEIYTEAGLDYEYSVTNDIFDGIDPFERVKEAQPGDLVVWRGHVGIVVDPDEDSFYSSVMSGFSVASFTSTYWLSRGPRRYYRYRISEAQAARLLSRVASRRPAAPRKIVSDESRLVPNRDSEGGAPDSAMVVPDSTREKRVTQTQATSMVISTARKPTKDDIAAALSNVSDARADELEQAPFPARAIVIVDSFDVGAMNIQLNTGWVELKIRKIAVLSDNKMKMGKTVEKRRLALVRRSGAWVFADASETVYLLRPAAVRLISAKLALMARDPENTVDLKPWARALGALLAEDHT